MLKKNSTDIHVKSKKKMKRFWTDKLDNLLRRHYPKGDLDALAEKVGTTRCALKTRAQKLGLKRKVHVKHPWTERQLTLLRKHYADMPIQRLEQTLRHKRASIYSKAQELGLQRSPELIAEQGRLASQHTKSVATRFKIGYVPPNKGKREWQFRSQESIERCRQTQFKSGHQPHNAKPVGYESVRDGYVYVKVEHKRKMVLKHRHVWEQAHGPIPAGMNVTFRDGNRLNCALDNLELLSREECARRTVQTEAPEARAARVAKGAAKRNATIRRDRIRIHWGLEPKSKLVKRW